MPQAEDINKLKSEIEMIKSNQSYLKNKVEKESDDMDEIKMDVKLLAKEVQSLTQAVMQNNEILNGTNKNSILIRMALIESQQAYLSKKVSTFKEDKSKESTAKLQLIGVAFTAVISFISSIVVGIFSYYK